MRLSNLSLFAFCAVRSKMTKSNLGRKGLFDLYLPIMVKDVKEGAGKGTEAEVIKEYC